VIGFKVGMPHGDGVNGVALCFVVLFIAGEKHDWDEGCDG
jgi:hypothetical protein